MNFGFWISDFEKNEGQFTDPYPSPRSLARPRTRLENPKFEIQNSKSWWLVLSTTSVLLLLNLLLSACTPAPVIRPSAPPVRYLELATAYNRNVAMMDQLWARADIEMRWQQNGKRQRETGEGHLMLMPPDKVALSLGKLGQTLFWAGCDAHEYWLFDLRDEGVVHVGRHANFDPRRIDVLPIPVRPLDVTKLLGLVYLPLSSAERDTVLVGVDGSDWVIDLPQQQLSLSIDPATFTARSVRLMDKAGNIVVASELREPVRVEIQNLPPAKSPRLPSVMTIRVPRLTSDSKTDDPGQLTLQLKGLTDGRDDDRIRPRQFDLAALYRAHKPKHIVDLDHGVR